MDPSLIILIIVGVVMTIYGVKKLHEVRKNFKTNKNYFPGEEVDLYLYCFIVGMALIICPIVSMVAGIPFWPKQSVGYGYPFCRG